MRTLAALAALGLALATGPAAADDPKTAKVGEKAPDFRLADLEGEEHDLASSLAAGKIVVLEWFNADCPFVRKHHARNKTMKDLAAKYADRVVWLAICSSAEGAQGFGAERNRQAAEEYGIVYPILLDPEGTVGRLYDARATPHLFVIGADGVLAYSGAIDDDPGRALGRVNYVAAALEAIAAGRPVETPETRPYGCAVKYR